MYQEEHLQKQDLIVLDLRTMYIKTLEKHYQDHQKVK